MKYATVAVGAVLLAGLSAPAGAAEGEQRAVEYLGVPRAGAASSTAAQPSGAASDSPEPTAPAPTGSVPASPSVPDPAEEAAKAAEKAAKQAAKKAAKKAARKAAKKQAKKEAKKQEPKFVKERVGLSVSPGEGTKYGVGQLVTIDFDRSIKRKRAVEDAIRVTSRKALPKGAWGWIDDNTAVYRPRRFWPGNAKIKFQMDMRKVTYAIEGDTRYMGAANKTHILRTARSFVLRIKDSKHRLYVERNGKIERSFPVSLGKSAGGYQTRSGIKIITGDKSAALRMTGTDRLTGESWDVVSPYSIRLTPSGEYIHGAPWAYSRIGLWNGSHGCTNMYVADAKWLFNRVRAGDPTVTRGTGRPMETWNGTPGAYWNYTWKQWRAKSASKR